MLEIIGREKIKLDQKQIDNVVELLRKEEEVSDDKNDKKVEQVIKKDGTGGKLDNCTPGTICEQNSSEKLKALSNEALVNPTVEQIKATIPPQISETPVLPEKPEDNTVKDKKEVIDTKPPKL